jgi:hypothetical protein
MSVSNQIYSSSIGAYDPMKNILATEGEKLVSKPNFNEKIDRSFKIL